MIIAGVGYRNLRDHSLGVAVAEALMERTFPAGVEVEDLSYNPIAVVQRLGDEPEGSRFKRAIVVGAISRPPRKPGTVAAYRWDCILPSPEGIQSAVVDAVTGIIYLDNTLVVGRHFKALPDETIVVEVEPEVEEFGDSFSPAVVEVFEAVCDLVATLAISASAVLRLPRAALGGRPLAREELS